MPIEPLPIVRSLAQNHANQRKQPVQRCVRANFRQAGRNDLVCLLARDTPQFHTLHVFDQPPRQQNIVGRLPRPNGCCSQGPRRGSEEYGYRAGMRALRQDGIEKVLQGVTDIQQVSAVCN
jgi:hypothetical protein